MGLRALRMQGTGLGIGVCRAGLRPGALEESRVLGFRVRASGIGPSGYSDSAAWGLGSGRGAGGVEGDRMSAHRSL